MKFSSAVLLISFVTLLSGCSKNSSSNNNSSDISSIIQITSPTPASIYFNGSTLQVRGNISDPNGLNSAKLVIKANTGVLLYQTESPTGNVTYYNLNWDWPITGITTSTPVTLTVTAKDYNSKLISKDVSLTLID
ncbi:MAG: hypothetical protein IPH18_00455 [Chitinophagaceae bacterium]|nr:hypothetical protein [Chitinophagaceae bacterium]MBK8951515.1 hypothetical protein [Chitinophagaceae bacterium]